MGEYRRFFRESGGIEFFVAFVFGWSLVGLINSGVFFLLTLPMEWLRAKAGGGAAGAFEFQVDGVTFSVQWISFAENLVSLVVLWLLLLVLVVRPANRRRGTMRPCPECLGDMPAAARRCWNCGTQVPKAASM
jgi:large conductance mechanosensitive channel